VERLRHALMTPAARYSQDRCRVLAGERQESMNVERSLGAILMTFRIRTCASRPSAQRPYTVAVVTPKCSATCLTDRSRSGPPWLAPPEDPGALVPRRKPDTKSLLNGASGGAEWKLLSERFPMFSTACNPVLPPPTLAPDLPKLNVAGSSPISRSKSQNSRPRTRVAAEESGGWCIERGDC
jgi:hypothetical protein